MVCVCERQGTGVWRRRAAPKEQVVGGEGAAKQQELLGRSVNPSLTAHEKSRGFLLLGTVG